MRQIKREWGGAAFLLACLVQFTLAWLAWAWCDAALYVLLGILTGVGILSVSTLAMAAFSVEQVDR